MASSAGSEEEVSCSTQTYNRRDRNTEHTSNNSRHLLKSKSPIPYFTDERREADRLARLETNKMLRLYGSRHKSRSRSHGPNERSSTQYRRYNSPPQSSRYRRNDSPPSSSRHRRYDSPSPSSSRHRRYDSPSPSRRHRRYETAPSSSRYRRYDSPPHSSRHREHGSSYGNHSRHRRSSSRDRQEYMSHRRNRIRSRSKSKSIEEARKIFIPVPVAHHPAFGANFVPLHGHFPPPIPHYRFMRYPIYPPPMPHMLPYMRRMRPPFPKTISDTPGFSHQ